ncbi:hypothetical protein EVJ58_g1645 [Rhodofomes roseus]|uniref:Uncharacterized protein n=1 Tax=Rhodofomes roseus TaxID=34475 RepID=A0A4Y9Z0S1_9APHY|nr:hypothetical protein EVJ58_g1645 [Rhodofomes roseus]
MCKYPPPFPQGFVMLENNKRHTQMHSFGCAERGCEKLEPRSGIRFCVAFYRGYKREKLHSTILQPPRDGDSIYFFIRLALRTLSSGSLAPRTGNGSEGTTESTPIRRRRGVPSSTHSARAREEYEGDRAPDRESWDDADTIAEDRRGKRVPRTPSPVCEITVKMRVLCDLCRGSEMDQNISGTPEDEDYGSLEEDVDNSLSSRASSPTRSVCSDLTDFTVSTSLASSVAPDDGNVEDEASTADAPDKTNVVNNTDSDIYIQHVNKLKRKGNDAYFPAESTEIELYCMQL